MRRRFNIFSLIAAVLFRLFGMLFLWLVTALVRRVFGVRVQRRARYSPSDTNGNTDAKKSKRWTFTNRKSTESAKSTSQRGTTVGRNNPGESDAEWSPL